MKSKTLSRSILCVQLIVCSVGSAQVVITDTIREYLASESTVFLLENARLIDGTGTPALEGLSVLIESGFITGIGSTELLDVPSTAERINLAGHTIVPGLIMMHEHVDYTTAFDPQWGFDQLITPQPYSIPKLLLAAGITTVRTAGGASAQLDINLRKAIAQGDMVGPTYAGVGPFLNGADSPFLQDFIVETVAEGHEVVRFWVSQGANWIKVYADLTPEVMRAVIEEAHLLGAKVAGHLGKKTSCAEAAEFGIDTIEHGFRSCLVDFAPWLDEAGKFDEIGAEAKTAELIRTLVENGVVLDLTPFDRPSPLPTGTEIEEIASMLSPQWRELTGRDYSDFATGEETYLFGSSGPQSRSLERAFLEAGGKTVVGADALLGAVPGYANHWRLEALARSLPPVEVIRMASSDAADVLDISDRTGTIAVGLEADLYVVRGAPDVNMTDIRNTAYVFKDGLSYDSTKLRDAARGRLGMQ